MSRNPKIVIVDDSPAITTLCERTANKLGFECEQFQDPTAFIDRFCKPSKPERPDFDILLLDLIMPEMDGIEVLRTLAEVDTSASLILMSGFHAEVLNATKTLAAEKGFHVEATLSKPFQIHELQWILENLAESNLDISDGTDLELTVDELERALERREIVAYFQPQVSFRTDEVLGVEALARWNHPEHGIISPGHFIPLIETRAQMEALTRRIITCSIEQAAQWRQQGLCPRVAINTSASVITDLSLPERVEQEAQKHGVDASQLTFEVTETAIMEELDTSLDILTRLRIKGVELSIDDFGTGYSSMSQLHRVPFSELKVDRSFVDSAPFDDESRAIVKTTITLGHELGMRVVAEGVETQDSFDLIRELDCDLAQGYLIAHPMPGDEVPDWIANYQ